MAKGVEYDDANSFMVMMVFLGMFLVPPTYIYFSSIRLHGLFVPHSVPNQAPLPGAVRSSKRRRKRNLAQILKLAMLLVGWAIVIWLFIKVSEGQDCCYELASKN